MAFITPADPHRGPRREADAPGSVKIGLRHLGKRFGDAPDFVAVDDITIEIASGEFFVIVGPSGCGKTTLLRILACLERQSAGSIEIAGSGGSRPLNAMVFQGDSLFPWYTKSAILPLLLLIFGLGEASKVAMVALGMFYPVLINTVAGVANINRIYLDVGRNFGARGWQVFRTIALPGALPSILAGIKIGVGMGLILIVIAEMIGAKTGIGYMIWNSWQILTVDTMYVGLLVVAVLGFVFSQSLDVLERRLVPWLRT